MRQFLEWSFIEKHDVDVSMIIVIYHVVVTKPVGSGRA